MDRFCTVCYRVLVFGAYGFLCVELVLGIQEFPYRWKNKHVSDAHLAHEESNGISVPVRSQRAVEKCQFDVLLNRDCRKMSILHVSTFNISRHFLDNVVIALHHVELPIASQWKCLTQAVCADQHC